MLVALTPAENELCAQILQPLTMLKVAHPGGATERMLVTRPKIVVYRESKGTPEGSWERLVERAQDIGAGVVRLDESLKGDGLRAALLDALHTAELAARERED
jgi:hypothetical protein